jgi:hypothetical protein
MMTPPIDGPSRRAALNIDELSAMALGRSARSSIISTTKACRPGMSKELIRPWKAASSSTSTTVMRPVSVSTASAADCAMARTCVTTRTRRRSQRSTSTPATGPSRKLGICDEKLTAPSRKAGCGSR